MSQWFDKIKSTAFKCSSDLSLVLDLETNQVSLNYVKIGWKYGKIKRYVDFTRAK